MRWVAIFVFLVPALQAERCDPPPDFSPNGVLVSKAGRERFQALLAQHPDILDYQYLQARSLVGINSKEALRLYGEILEKDPDYPWVHLSQLEILKAEGFRDRAKLQASFEAFTRVCPASIAPYHYIDQIPDHQLAAKAAARLRALLKDATNERDLEAYRVLWKVELQELPNEQETRQIAEDVKRLLPLEKSRRVREVMEAGAFLDGDRDLRQRLAAQRQAPRKEDQAWTRQHPHPRPDASPEALHAYAEARLALSAKMLELAPGRSFGYWHRFVALDMLGASPEELLQAGNVFLAAAREEEHSSTNLDISVATAFVKRGIYLDKVPALVEEIVTRYQNDLRSIHSLPEERMMLVYQSVDTLGTLVHAYEKSGQGGKAHETLRGMHELVAESRPPAAVNERVLSFYALARGAMWITTAQLAEHEGRKLDALSAYREVPLPLRVGALTAQRKLWKELGGTDEGWAQWEAAEPSAPEKPEVPVVADSWSRKLAPLSIKDFDGNLWTLDQLKGKTTIAVVWATWCGPCVSELPHFARLAERVKGRDDMAAISFNVDENAFVAESFMKKRGFTFPALAAKQYAEDLMGDLGIPRTWIIKDGVIVYESVGFGGDADQWIEEMLGRLK